MSFEPFVGDSVPDLSNTAELTDWVIASQILISCFCFGKDLVRTSFQLAEVVCCG